MPLTTPFQRRCRYLVLGLCVFASVPAFAQSPESDRSTIDWLVPVEPPTEPVSIESMTPGAPAPELTDDKRSPNSWITAEPPAVGSTQKYHWSVGPVRLETLVGGDLGMDSFVGNATLEFRDLKQFTVSPQTRVVFLDGPTQTDLPPRLYSGLVEFRWFDRIGKPFFYELAFMPGIFTDGNALGGNAWRFQGRAVGYLAISEQTQFALGATYLDRDDVPVLPILGVIHSPREDVRLEILFPRPRVLKRIANDSAGESWVYVSGEFGGGAWAIERANGQGDIANYRDYRLLGGFERKFSSGAAAVLEGGYVFGRQLNYASARGDFNPNPAFVLRCGFSR